MTYIDPRAGFTTLRVWQGLQRDYAALQIVNNDGTPAVFTSGATLSATVWEGQNQAAIFTMVPTWSNAGAGWATGQFSLSFAAALTATLDPAGEYHILVSATTSGLTSPVWEGILKILATPGSTVPSPPDLISYDYCMSQLSVLSLTQQQIDLIPWLISGASQAVRLECNDRYFDLRTLTEWHEVYEDGYCRLWQEPIQQILSVQGIPNLALTVANTSNSVQRASAYFSYTGYDGGYSSNAKTATGIILSSVSSGVASSITLLYATYPTIGQMATAINTAGSGWSATADSSWSSWACTELTGGFVGQECTRNASPGTGAMFNVLTGLENAKLRPRSPMLWVGQNYGGNFLAQRWGPGGYQMFGNQDVEIGLVRVTYVAGFPTIPPDVQFQTAQLVKWRLELGIQELLLKAENADDYDYELAPELVHNMPKPVREALGKWRYSYA